MIDWQDMKTAPYDGTHILIYGQQKPHDMINVVGPIVFSGYWDTLDQAWVSTGSTWAGPFYEAWKWLPLPDGPEKPIQPAARREWP